MLGSTFVETDLVSVASAPDPQWSLSLETLAPGVGGIVAENRRNDENWFDALGRLLPVIASTYQQKQLLDVQVERARQGLPPLEAGQYAPGVKVGLDPTTQNLLMWGGIAALGLLAYMALRR